MVKAINWNKIQDDLDLDVWNRLTSFFWLPEKIALSNDISSWNTLTEAEQTTVMKVFANLTTLDTLQSFFGGPVMMQYARTPHEEAVFANITFMESVHARSYSSIFTTLADSERIDNVFRWADEDPQVQKKAQIVRDFYERAEQQDDKIFGLMAKAASVLLESFLFYSGFYVSFHWASHGKLTNTADIIRLILRDESLHGYYIGYKYQLGRAELTPSEQDMLDLEVEKLAHRLYENELHFTEAMYDELGWTEDVKTYVRYNLNKAMNNLGRDGFFHGDEVKVKPSILTQMTTDSSDNHDFFSSQGSTYVVGTAEETTDDDWG